MKQIRIGNDICLQATLKGLTVYDRDHVKQIRAYLINVESQNPQPIKVDACRCNCGYRGYHFYPYCGCARPYITVNPAGGPAPLPCGYRCCGGFCGLHGWDRFGCGRCHNHYDPYFIPDRAIDRFLAPSKMVEGDGKIEVYFPAKDQLECGTYKLVVVVSTFEEGWGRSNVHTYTIDYGEIFTLVNGSDGESGSITIDVDELPEPTPGGDDEGGSTPSGISHANTNTYGTVKLSEGLQDSDNNDDVVTMGVLNDLSVANVSDNTLILGTNVRNSVNPQQGNVDDEAD